MRRSNDAIYIVQPLAKEIIQERIGFFDESLRSTMSEFLERFAGSGEEIANARGNLHTVIGQPQWSSVMLKKARWETGKRLRCSTTQ